MQRIELLCVTLAAACALPCVGCGESSDLPATAPVTGIVTYQGQPVPNAQITFYPDEGRKPASGTADEDGAYSLTTFSNGDGAIPGTHTVTVSAYDSSNVGASMKSLIPEKFAGPKTSPLKVTVEDKDNETPLELVD